jgi:hypothetical protein
MLADAQKIMTEEVETRKNVNLSVDNGRAVWGNRRLINGLRGERVEVDSSTSFREECLRPEPCRLIFP